MRAMQRVLQRASRLSLPARSYSSWSFSRTGLHTATANASADGQEPETALLRSIRQRIQVRGGPLSVAEYMQETLTNPLSGFYMHRDVFGRSGDFITSPEVSQMFGEMMSIWTLVTWMHMGQPKSLRLVELGPGRGTLMADLLRGASSFPDFAAALEVNLVELSPAMRTKQWMSLKCSPVQREQAASYETPQQPRANGAAQPGAATPGPRVDGAAESSASHSAPGSSEQPETAWSDIGPGCKVRWHASLDAVPQEGAPAIYIAHEFFDALPVHQFVKDPQRGWLEKMVDVADETATTADVAATTATAGPGKVQEMGHSSSSNGKQGSSATASRQLESADAVSGIVRRSRASHAPSPSTPSSNSSSNLQGSNAAAADAQQQDPHHLRLVLSPRPTPASSLLVERRLAALEQETADMLTAIEIGAHSMATAEKLAQRIGEQGGAALIIDYGQDRPYADSLTAIRNHKGVHVLSQPGTADLSAWVDFSALRQAAVESGASVKVHGPVSQGQLLLSLGIQARLQALAELATEQQTEGLLAGYKRLVESGADSMGSTYKALAITHADMPTPVGFEMPDPTQ